jgi:hypothetical protein
MGTWNFDRDRLNAIEQRQKSLEEQIEALQKENALLKAKLPPEKEKKRLVSESINNYDKIKELCAVTSDENGQLVHTDSRKLTEQNITVFTQNLMRVFKPMIYAEPHMKKFRIRGTSFEALSEEEYKLACETIEAVIDTLYYAKKKAEELNNGKTNT